MTVMPSKRSVLRGRGLLVVIALVFACVGGLEAIAPTPAVAAPGDPAVVSRSTAWSGVVGAPSGVAVGDHVGIHALVVDLSATPPTWSASPGFVLRFQRTKSVGAGYYFHWAAFDSAGNDVSGRSSYSAGVSRSVLAQVSQAFRVVNTSGYAGAAAADGVLSGSSLVLPSVVPSAAGSLVVASISAGGGTTIASGPAGWTRVFGESDEFYLYSLIAGGATPSSTVSYTGVDVQTAVVHAFAPAATNPTPEMPTGLVAAANDGAVDLTWALPAGGGAPPIDDYVVEHRERGGEWVLFADGVSALTSVTVTGLANYDQYEFRVAAVAAGVQGQFGAPVGATPTDGNDPQETFNYADGSLIANPNWVAINPMYGDLQIVDGHAVGSGDPDGTGTSYALPVGPNVEVTIDALLGDNYNEVTAILRLDSTTELSDGYLLQWVTDGHYAEGGPISGPALQIWRIDSGPTFVLLAEAPLANFGERTLTFGADGSTLYIAEAGTVLLSHTDATHSTGDFIALGQSNLSGGAPSRIDNMRWRALPAQPL